MRRPADSSATTERCWRSFFAVWVWAAIEPVYRGDWWLENVLIFLAVPLVIGLGFYFRLSNLSYTLITINATMLDLVRPVLVTRATA